MNISDYSFHDSTILKITEHVEGQILELLLDFPIDWETNQFEHYLLRFNDVTNYEVSSIPFDGKHVILEIKEHAIVRLTFGSGRNEIAINRNKIEIITNAGKRIIEFTTCELVKPTNS